MKLIRTVLICLILAVVYFEILISSMLAHPVMAQFGPYNFLRNIYSANYRNIIQDESQFARFDPYLKYTLKPGTFIFRNPEFSNEFKINKLGLRDDDISLKSPEIIVIGDSVPMGWGVNQNETFAKLIEKKTSRRVLNAAISSYATVEAIRILDRIDTSKTKNLILYYEHWKFPENVSYYKLKNKFETIKLKEYNQAKEDYIKAKKYYPGKYTILALRTIIGKVKSGIRPQNNSIKPASMEYEANVLLYTLFNASHKNFENINIIILCEKDFVEPLTKTVATAYPAYVNRIIPTAIIDIYGENAYILDDHPTAKWHSKMADKITKMLN
jgi:hypothetical protein